MTQSEKGFTLLESLVVIVMVGIVAAIAAPGWLNFVEKSQLTVGRDKLYLAMRKAQSEAQHKRTGWQFSVRERDGAVEWATHPNSVTPAVAQWEALDSKSIQLDAESTFTSSAGVYYVRFDEGGNPHHLGRVTLSGKHFSMNKRCVIISTLIGAARKSQEQPTPDPTYTTRDRFCY
jgi:prepilin-type N-terminal cleavage/methylation domain-containing protein